MKLFISALVFVLASIALTNARRCNDHNCDDVYRPVCATLSNGDETEFDNRCMYNAAKECDPSVTRGACYDNYHPFGRIRSYIHKTVQKFKKMVKKMFVDDPRRRREDEYDSTEDQRYYEDRPRYYEDSPRYYEDSPRYYEDSPRYYEE